MGIYFLSFIPGRATDRGITPYLFILCAEGSATKSRNNRNIKGAIVEINMQNNNLKS